MNLTALLLAIVAPVFYWALGLPLALFSRRAALAPLLGCAVAGLAAEWAMMARLPVGATSIALVGVGAAMTVWIGRRHGPDVRSAVMEWLPCYFVSILAVSLSPFPAIGAWSGDWLLNLRVGESVFAGSLPAAMLKRPPLLAAATAPLWVCHEGLYPYQITVAVASASTLTATLHVLRWLRPRATWLWLGPLMLSPFFLHNTAAAWSKLLAGAFVLLATMEACRGRRLPSAIMFALAVASHEGFIIWTPFLLVLWLGSPDHRFATLAKAAATMLVAGVVIAGPLIFWVLWKHGLHAKVAANPVVTTHDMMASDPTPAWVLVLLSIVTAFVGWAPVEDVWAWFHRADAFSAAVVAKEIFWILASWFSTLTGTIFGFLLPFVFVWGPWRKNLSRTEPVLFRRWPLAGVAVAIVLNGGLSGLYAAWGMAQAALAPLMLGLYVCSVAALDPSTREGLISFRRLTWASIVVGGLPWLLVNLGTSAGLWLSAGFRERMRTGSESDYISVLEQHLQPLGMTAFPLVPLIFGVLLLIWIAAPRWSLSRAESVAER